MQYDLAIGTHRQFLSYIDKSREYYLAKGHNNPYRWAAFDDVPFTAMSRPVEELRIGVVTTAFLSAPTDGPKRAYAEPVSDLPDAMFTDDLSWHKKATDTDDLGTFLPIRHLQSMVEQGEVGSLSPRFYGVPTMFSQRATLTRDAPEVLAWCREDEVDIVLLIPL